MVTVYTVYAVNTQCISCITVCTAKHKRTLGVGVTLLFVIQHSEETSLDLGFYEA